MADCSFDDILLDKEVCVTLTKNDFGNEANITPHSKNLQLLLKIQNQPGSSKEILLQITDEQDPLILFTSILSENDYPHLKSSQKLLVDFATFPHHFCNLIKTCLAEQIKTSPKFILILKINGENPFNQNAVLVDEKIFLEVIEVNVFKHLCHLSITLIPASLQRKLHHLSNCIRTLKVTSNTEKQKSHQEKFGLDQEIHTLKNKLYENQAETETLRKDMQLKLTKESEKHEKVLLQSKNKLLQLQSDFDRRLSKEKADIENFYKSKLRDVENKNENLVKKNSMLGTAKEKLEKAFRDLSQQNKQNEYELRKASEDVSKLSKLKVKLQDEIHYMSATIEKFKKQMENLNEDIVLKDNLIQNLHHSISEAQRERSLLQEEYDTAQSKIKKREASCQQIFVEFNKSLDVIRKFQSRSDKDQVKSIAKTQNLIYRQKLKERRSKINESLQACNESKKLLEEKDGELRRAQVIANQLPTYETQMKEINEKLKDAEAQILEYEKTIKFKESSISFLNRKLNELEGNEALMKKAPIAEAYISQNTNRNIYHSTPLSGNSGHPSIENKEIFRHMSDVKLPEVLEEDSLVPKDLLENKETAVGLPDKYFEPVKRSKSYPIRGLLRQNAIRPPVKEIQEPEAVIGSRTAKNFQASRGRGHKKVFATKSSNYFNT